MLTYNLPSYFQLFAKLLRVLEIAVKEIVRCQLFVLVAGKVRLDNRLPREAQRLQLQCKHISTCETLRGLEKYVHAGSQPAPPP